MYTSGTTGRPKGAMLTHGNIDLERVNVLVDTDLTADERALVSAPLFHTAGAEHDLLPVLLKGGTCVLVESFDPAATLDLDRTAPGHLHVRRADDVRPMARHPRWADADLSSLRILICGGAPVPAPLIAAYQERGLTFLQGYGMTEAAPGVLFLDAEHAVEQGGLGRRAALLHRRTGRPARRHRRPTPGETGEIVVRGPHVMPGYWGLPEETAAALRRRLVPHRGRGAVDEDGYVIIVDRIKDMIISGGENIYPAEIEDRPLPHPDVVECARHRRARRASGARSPRAVVVAREGAAPDPDELLASLAGRLAKYKIPKSVVVADELPRTASGKLLKKELRPHALRHQRIDREHHMSITVAHGLDELKKLAGSDLGTSEWIEVTQERINTFADATGDHQWIHVDPERAARGRSARTIAHGYLTLSLFIPLFTESAGSRASPRRSTTA